MYYSIFSLLLGGSACDFILSYFVLIYLLFGRIDSVFTTVEIGVCECNPKFLSGLSKCNCYLPILTYVC